MEMKETILKTFAEVFGDAEGIIHDRKQSDLVAVLLEDQRRGTVQHALQ